MKIRLVTFFLLLSLHGTVVADANKGEFLGYRIGDRLLIDDPVLIKSDRRFLSDGFTSFFESREDVANTFYLPVRPANNEFDEVYLLITPVTYTVIEIRGFIRASSTEKYAATKQASDVQNRFFKILRTIYPSWKTARCGWTDDDWYSSCQIIGPNYKFELEIDNTPSMPDPDNPKNSLGITRSVWDVEIALMPNTGDLRELEREEKKQFVKNRDLDDFTNTDKKAL